MKPDRKNAGSVHADIDFDHNGWTVETLRGGVMKITWRLPRNTRHLPVGIARIEEPSEPGKPTAATNADGQRYELIKSQDIRGASRRRFHRPGGLATD